MTNPPQTPNPLGNASLGLGIASAALVFGIGLCALTGAGQQWIRLAGTPLFVCGGASAFLGFLAVVIGIAGLFGKDRSRGTAIVGLVLGLIGTCLYFLFLSLISRGG
jgi:Na+/melibiose symporter-like transporter